MALSWVRAHPAQQKLVLALYDETSRIGLLTQEALCYNLLRRSPQIC